MAEHDLTTDAGRVRFTIAERVDAPVFTDAEVTYALTVGGNVNGAAVILLRRLLTDSGRRAALFADPTPGAPVPDDALAIATLREAIAMHGGATVGIPRAIIGSLGSSPSDGDNCRPLFPRCGC